MTKVAPRRPRERGRAVLRLLAEHGPLTVQGLSSIIRPTIHERRLREILLRLRSTGLVHTDHDRIFQGAAHYYRLTRNSGLLGQLRTEGVLLDDAEAPTIRERERLHSETCAIWVEALRRLVPESRVVREEHFARDPDIGGVVLTGGKSPETRPDFIMTLGNARVAFEVERNKKSAKRLTRKFLRYANRSRFDGVVYLCSSEHLADTIKTVFLNHASPRAKRIGHYSSSFVLVGSLEVPHSLSSFRLAKADAEPTQFSDWLNVLRTISLVERRPADFAKQPRAAGS